MAPSEVEVVEADEGAPAGAWGGAEGEVVVTKHVNRRTNALTQRDEQLRAAGKHAGEQRWQREVLNGLLLRTQNPSNPLSIIALIK